MKFSLAVPQNTFCGGTCVDSHLTFLMPLSNTLLRTGFGSALGIFRFWGGTSIMSSCLMPNSAG